MATYVTQDATRRPVVWQAGLPTELQTEEEMTNALWAHNGGLLGPDGRPMLDEYAPGQFRPRPVWYSTPTHTWMINQALTAGGLA